VGISVALIEIVVGAFAGNIYHLTITPWINYLAGAGAILLTFLAGAKIDPVLIKKHFWSTMIIGILGFFAPFFGVFLVTHFIFHWPLQQAKLAGISLSTTSVAVVYAVMVETGLNETEIGKIILAACFINDFGTVLALGLLFANYDVWLLLFVIVTVISLIVLPKFTPWFFRKTGNTVSEPEIKFVFLVLFLLGGIADISKSEAVLPAYLVGLVLTLYFCLKGSWLTGSEYLHLQYLLRFIS
jgi:Kef-type K+ transport system membrane component KefB